MIGSQLIQAGLMFVLSSAFTEEDCLFLRNAVLVKAIQLGTGNEGHQDGFELVKGTTRHYSKLSELYLYLPRVLHFLDLILDDVFLPFLYSD